MSNRRYLDRAWVLKCRKCGAQWWEYDYGVDGSFVRAGDNCGHEKDWLIGADKADVGGDVVLTEEVPA